MNISIAYRTPCVVQDPRDPNVVMVVGVNETNDASLELNWVDISDISRPSPTRLGSFLYPEWFSASAERVCVLYSSNLWQTNVPEFYMRQFGARSYQATLMFNGTAYKPTLLEPALASPKLYSFTGAHDQFEWVTAYATKPDSYSNSSWVALVRSGGAPGFYHFRLQNYPPADAILSVGTRSISDSMPTLGTLTVFNETGSKGWQYPTTSFRWTNETGTNLQSLNAPSPVDMGDVVLSTDAFSITMNTTGYIVDKAPDGSGSTVLYSITPSSHSMPKLELVTVNGDVPRFMTGRTSTALRPSSLLLFGGLRDGKPTQYFHRFDTTTHTWYGLDLVKPYVRVVEKKTNIAAIAGGAVGGLVVLALAFFFIFRRYQRRHHRVVVSTSETETDLLKDQQAVVMTDTVYHQPLQHAHHFGIVHNNEAFVAETDQHLRQPLIVPPQGPTFHQSQASVLLPQAAAQSPLLPSMGCDYGSPSTSSATYTERGSALSPATIQSIQTSVPSTPGAPQYIPEGSPHTPL